MILLSSPLPWLRNDQADSAAQRQRLGSLGEAAFYGVLVALGCLSLALILGMVILPQWRSLHQFKETTATVQETRIRTQSHGKSFVYLPEVHVQYEANGRTWTTWTLGVNPIPCADRTDAWRYLKAFDKGSEVRCWYDPGDPAHAVVLRGYTAWSWLLLLLPVAFFSIGIGGLSYTLMRLGTSAERQSILSRQKTGLDLFDEYRDRRLLAMGSENEILVGPGTVLAHRLHSDSGQGLYLWIAGSLCVLWNSLALVPVILSVRFLYQASAIVDVFQWRTEWMTLLVAVLFLAIGVRMAFRFSRRVAARRRVGPIRVEVNHHPLTPGETVDLLVMQTGNLVYRSLKVSLVCEEESTFAQGTDARSEVQRVACKNLLVRENFAISPGRDLVSRIEFSVPAETMHSFRSEYNAVRWHFLIEGHADQGRDFVRTFPVLVNPMVSGGGP